MRRELHSSPVFQVHKAFLWRFIIVRKKGDRRDIQIAVTVEIRRDAFIGAVERIEKSFFEIPMTIVQVNADPMILFRGTLEVAAVAIGRKDVQMAIAIEIGEFEVSISPDGRLFDE